MILRVAIWRWSWLARSETFIRAQADSLGEIEAVRIGALKEISPLARSSDRIIFGSSAVGRTRARLFNSTRRDTRVTNILQQAHIDLIHAHFAPDAAVLIPTAQALRIPLVVTVHGWDVSKAPLMTGLRGRRLRTRIQQTFEYASTIICVSEAIATRAIALGAPRAKVVVHYTGLTVPHVRPRMPTRWDVLFIGRLVEKKGVDDLLRAVAMTKGRGTVVRLGIVGSGPMRGQLTELAASLGVSDNVSFVGSQTQEEIQQHLHSSLILAAPSKTAHNGDVEGLPTVLMEAAAAGLPVVATRHSGIEEVVEHGVTGLLSPEYDFEQLAAHIEQLMTDSSLRERLGTSGRDYIQDRFDISKQASGLERIYRDAVLASQRDQ